MMTLLKTYAIAGSYAKRLTIVTKAVGVLDDNYMQRCYEVSGRRKSLLPRSLDLIAPVDALDAWVEEQGYLIQLSLQLPTEVRGFGNTWHQTLSRNRNTRPSKHYATPRVVRIQGLYRPSREIPDSYEANPDKQ